MSMGGQALSRVMRETCQASPDLPICKFIEALGVFLPYLLVIIFGFVFYKTVIEPSGDLNGKLKRAIPLLLLVGGLPLLLFGQDIGLLLVIVGFVWMTYGDAISKTFSQSSVGDVLPKFSKTGKTILILAIACPVLLVLFLILIAL